LTCHTENCENLVVGNTNISVKILLDVN
jgi:hypothetical protein